MMSTNRCVVVCDNNNSLSVTARYKVNNIKWHALLCWNYIAIRAYDPFTIVRVLRHGCDSLDNIV